MMTRQEITLIRTILEDEVTNWEWELDNDTSMDKTWTREYLNNAQMALEAFNRETSSMWTVHDDDFYKDETNGV